MDEKVGVEITAEQDAAIVAFRSASVSDMEGIAAIARQIKDFIDNNHPKRVIFDFWQVKFFSSQVLGLLLEIRAKVEPYSGEVVISGINPQLQRVFRVTNLDGVFRFYPDRESALKASSAE